MNNNQNITIYYFKEGMPITLGIPSSFYIHIMS